MTEEKLCLPDPGEYIMVAMRKGNTELAFVVRPDRVDAELIPSVRALLDAMQKEPTCGQ